MSGLNVFFRRYLNNDASTDVPSATAFHTREVTLNESSRTTNSSPNAAVSLQQQHHQSSILLDTNDDDNDCLYQQSISTRRRASDDPGTSLRTEPVTTANATSSSQNSNALSYKEWRHQQTIYIQEYIIQRLFDSTTGTASTSSAYPSTNDANDNIDGAPSVSTSTSNNKKSQGEPEDDDDDDVVVESQSQQPLESQVFASQPPEHEMTGTSGEPTVINTSTRLVPNVYTDTYYIATHIQELDLYVHTFNAATVLPITKVWSKRTTLERRRTRRRPSKKPTVSLPPWSYQYDGPIAVLYERVLCMELFQSKGNSDKTQPHTDTQLHSLGQILDQGPATTSPAVTAAVELVPNMTLHNVPLLPKQFCPNMKIFWYDQYADLFHTIIADAYQSTQPPHQRATATTTTTTGKKDTVAPTVELYLSLQHVPAKCIFPYFDESRTSRNDDDDDDDGNHGCTARPDWYDEYHTVPYCICIGGDSAMIVRATAPNPDDDDPVNDDTTKTMGEESQGSSSTIDPTKPMDSTTNNIATCPIAFDADDQPNAEPIQIKCYMIHHGGWDDNNDETNEGYHNAKNDTDRTLPNEIVEYTISTRTKTLQMEVYHNPTDVVQIRSIWEEIHQQRSHLLLTKNSFKATQTHDNGNNTFRHQTMNTTTDNDDLPLAENELRRPSTPARMLLSELTSPRERLKRRRLINTATDDMQYQLSDIPNLPLKTSFSFYAAVLSFNQPYRTKRGDWTMSLQLVDDSLHLCEDGLVEMAFVHSVTCNIFVKPALFDTLPMIRFAGDIVRLSNVQIIRWKNEAQLVTTKESTFVTLRGNGMKPDGTQTKPEMFPSDDENVALSDLEWEHMLDMWHWAQRRMMLHATMKLAHRFRLSDMHLPDSTHIEAYGEANTRGDLTAMVAAVIPIVTDSSVAGVTPRGFVRVWDGTGMPKSDVLPIISEEAKMSIRDGDPPTSALIKIAKIIHKLKELRQNDDIQPPAKLSGRVANVAIWEKQHWELIDKGCVTVGSFIRLRNVQDTIFPNSQFRCLHVHAKSSLTPLPNLNFEVLHLLEEHNNRLLRMEPTNPDSGLLPLFIDHHLQDTNARTPQQPDVRTSVMINANIGLSSRSRVTTIDSPRTTYYKSLKVFMDAPVPSVFIGDVDILGMYPSVSDLVDNGIELICIRNTQNEDRFYRFGLQLRGTTPDDSTALLSAIVSDDRPGTTVGKQFFNISCAEAMRNCTAIYEMASKLRHEKINRRAQITSVEYNASKYFLLDHLQ